jgi:hypothetical protein
MDNAPQELANIRTHQVFMSVHVITGRVSRNNTRCFPMMSNPGNAYIAHFYIYNAYAIWSASIKNRSKEELLRDLTEVYAWLTTGGYWPLLHKMDNETSHDVKAFITLEQVKLQYTPPNMHHTNPAKCVFLTWKNHFTAGIAALPPSFPLAHWCRLMMQSNAMLNMMRPYCLNHLLSVHKVMKWTFLFDAMPMAPLGMEVLVLQKPG